MKDKNRLEKAKAFYNEEVSKANPSIENSIWDIKQDLLVYIYEEMFNGTPSKEEQRWLDAEEEIVLIYRNTEGF